MQAGFVDDPYAIQMTVDADGALCYADGSGIFRQVPGGGLTEQVVDGVGTALSLSSNYLAHFSCAPDGSYLAVIDENSAQRRLYRYAFDASLSAAAETLEVWSLEENATVRAAIQAFLQAEPNYTVDYQPALDADAALTADDALRTLNTELLAGGGPDVLILDGADLDAFAASGLLADLSAAVDVGALCDFVAEDYAAGETVPLLPARFAVPLMHGAPGTLDGVSTLDDAAALAQQYAPRPGGQSWAALADDQRYAFGFDSVESLVRFALQTSQPALLADGALDNAALRSLLGFVQTVGGYYGMAAYPAAEPNGSAGQFGGEDVLFWEAGMTEYAMAKRAAFGFGNMITPGWLGATSPEQTPDGQTILQPGLCRGVYLPCCFAAVNAGSDRQEAALAFVRVLFGDTVQGG